MWMEFLETFLGVNYFRKNVLSEIFDRDLNTSLAFIIISK